MVGISIRIACFVFIYETGYIGVSQNGIDTDSVERSLARISLFNIYCYFVRFVFRAIDFVHKFAQYRMYQNKYDCYYGSFLWISERISK